MAETLTQQGSRALTHFKQGATTISTGVGVLWVVHLVNVLSLGMLNSFGIFPRTWEGLVGILFAPFLHGSIEHLLMNTLSFVLLGGILVMRGRREFWAVSVLGALGSGLGAWLIGAAGSVHIGLSGVLFAYLGFLMARGFFERSVGTILLSLAVILTFGSMVWGVLPLTAGVSWEAHLFGLLSGIGAASRYGRRS
jgi:membrane associated rhomboid family serine protease